MALGSFDTLYKKMKANGGWKHDELIVFSGRQSGKSWFNHQYLTQWFMEPEPPFARVLHEKLRHDMIMCDVNRDIQDWLMQNFELGKMWKYFDIKDSKSTLPAYGRDRVAMREEVYTSLVLRWS